MRGMTFKPVADLARWTRIALFACAAFYAISAAALPGNLAQLNQLEAQAMGQQVLVDGTPSSDFASVGLSAFILTTVVFLFFFHRAYSNLAVLGPGEQRWSTGWSVGSWFIPILNLFRPKQIANDIWRGSDPDLPREVSAVGWQDGRIPALLFGLWWALWLITNWAGIAASGGSTETIPDLKDQSIRYLISDTTDLIAALLCAAVVAAVTRRQDERARRHGVTAAV
jgi:hypothetical protein